MVSLAPNASGSWNMTSARLEWLRRFDSKVRICAGYVGQMLGGSQRIGRECGQVAEVAS